MIKKLLIANRGEIACRIIRTANRMGIATVAVYSEADASAMHVRNADQAYLIGPAPAVDSYLNRTALLRAAKQSGSDAIHPGYGFLAENADFAQAVRDAGLVFIGPPTQAIRDMGAKDNAKALMHAAEVPIVPGYYGADQSTRRLTGEAEAMGFPVLLKAALGGGGKGMRIVPSKQTLRQAIDSAKREAQAAFADDRLLIERYLSNTRHIEVQVFADSHGHVVHLFERDCSLQRRHQKVIEEAPAPGLTSDLRERMGRAAIAAAKAVSYEGAGTIEFLLTADDQFYFMEMNTRLQVEHSVSELITGQDFVEWQLRIASGEKLPLKQSEIVMNGHAIEARIYAEVPENNFLPTPGLIEYLHWPRENAELRIDTGVEAGDWVSPHYDPMIAKMTSHGETRTTAINRLIDGLNTTGIIGPGQNLAFLIHLLNAKPFVDGTAHTSYIDAQPTEGFVISNHGKRLALAAAARYLANSDDHQTKKAGQSGSDPHSPWHEMAGWRLGRVAPRWLHLDCGGSRFEVVIKTDGEARWFDIDGQVIDEAAVTSAQIIQKAGSLYLFGFGGPIKVIRFDPLQAHNSADDTKNKFIAPMPGKITAVNIEVDDRVAKGDVVMVLEAMKMEHAITAPFDGIIREVCVQQDQQVDGGVVLLAMDADHENT